jgi:Gluconate 2-dehydrogenase subunit 3
MKRRTLLKSLAGVVVARPVAALAQTPPSGFTTAQIATLNAIAEVVLPSEIGAVARERAVKSFVSWFANYKQGADMGHGYGSSTVRQPAGPSPIARYPEQFDRLEAAARAQGAASFRALPAAARVAIVEKFLNEPAPVNRLPAQPTGANLVADFMGRYFTSGDAWDVCYRAEIGRDRCRLLDGSEKPPAPLTRRGH